MELNALFKSVVLWCPSKRRTFRTIVFRIPYLLMLKLCCDTAISGSISHKDILIHCWAGSRIRVRGGLINGRMTSTEFWVSWNSKGSMGSFQKHESQLYGFQTLTTYGNNTMHIHISTIHVLLVSFYIFFNFFQSLGTWRGTMTYFIWTFKRIETWHLIQFLFFFWLTIFIFSWKKKEIPVSQLSIYFLLVIK